MLYPPLPERSAWGQVGRGVGLVAIRSPRFTCQKADGMVRKRSPGTSSGRLHGGSGRWESSLSGADSLAPQRLPCSSAAREPGDRA